VLRKVLGPRRDDIREQYRALHSKLHRGLYMAPTVGNEEQEASMDFKWKKDEKTRNAYRLSMSNRTRRAVP
jgi:hypothetical protein